MASNLECLGLPAPDLATLNEVLRAALSDATLIGTADEKQVVRWQDPSGVRLTVTGHESRVVDLVPSLRSDLQVRFADLHAINEVVSMMTVLGPDGEQRTKAAFELEQRNLMPPHPPSSGEVSIVVLGSHVAIHDNAEAFAASQDSLLNPRGEVGPDSPRVAATSFISHGIFGGPPSAKATARMAGVVQSAERRTNALTGEAFLVARVTNGSFLTDVCLSAREHSQAPAPGAVIAGTVFVVASIPELEQTTNDDRMQ